MPNTYNTLPTLFTAIADAIRAKTGSSADIIADNFPTEIANIPSGGGLIPSGLPSDGATRLGYYIPADAPSTAMTAYIRCTPSVADGVTIDWGDGTTTVTNSTTVTNYSHTYTTIPQDGYYIQTIKCTNGTVKLIGDSTNSIFGATSVFYNRGRIRWAVIGSDVTQLQYTFRYCSGLQEIKMPSTEVAINGYVFQFCYMLAYIDISNTTLSGVSNFANSYIQEVKLPQTTQLPASLFSGCSGLLSVTIPNTVTQILTSAFYGCSLLATLIIPSGVTSIGNSALQTLTGLQELHFKSTTPPTCSGAATFTSLPTTCKIYVPAGQLSAYTSAANYPSSSTYTYVEE